MISPAKSVTSAWPKTARSVTTSIAEKSLRSEALAGAVDVCRVVSAGLGEQIGDFAALSIATLE
jgi:glucokinase